MKQITDLKELVGRKIVGVSVTYDSSKVCFFLDDEFVALLTIERGYEVGDESIVSDTMISSLDLEDQLDLKVIEKCEYDAKVKAREERIKKERRKEDLRKLAELKKKYE